MKEKLVNKFNDEYRKYLKNKTVALVGPGWHTKNTKQQKLIDSYDVVVRINDGIELTKIYSKDIGKRTDILYCTLKDTYFKKTSIGGDLYRKKIFTSRRIKEYNKIIKWITITHAFFHQSNVRKLIDMIKDTSILINLVEKDTFNRVQSGNESKISAGIITIFDLLQYEIKELYITGITFYDIDTIKVRKNKFYRSGYKRKPVHIKAMAHDVKKELFFFIELYKRDKRIVCDKSLKKIVNDNISKNINEDNYKLKRKKPHIPYKRLLKVVAWGLFTKPMKGNNISWRGLKGLTPIKGAMHNGGKYVGSPGKDIYLMLPYLSKNQMKEVAEKLAYHFSNKPPRTNVQYSACIRFIYGQFEKQGVLKSEKDFSRMKKEKKDWSLSRKFLNYLVKELKKTEKYYGLTIVFEMEGHRLGDEAVINNDKDKLEQMEKKYLKSVDCAFKCNSYKHMFTLYYWACEYFYKFGDIEKAAEYSKLALENASKYYLNYFPVEEDYYSERLKYCMKYMKQNDPKEWEIFYNEYKDKFKSKKISNSLRKMK